MIFCFGSGLECFLTEEKEMTDKEFVESFKKAIDNINWCFKEAKKRHIRIEIRAQGTSIFGNGYDFKMHEGSEFKLKDARKVDVEVLHEEKE